MEVCNCNNIDVSGILEYGIVMCEILYIFCFNNLEGVGLVFILGVFFFYLNLLYDINMG